MSQFEEPLLRRFSAALSSADDDVGIAEVGLDRFELAGLGEQLRIGASPDDLADFVEEVIRVAKPDETIEVGNWLVTELLVDTDELPFDVERIADNSISFPEPQVGWVLSRGNPDQVVERLTNAIERTTDSGARGRYARLLHEARVGGGTPVGPVFGGGVGPARPDPGAVASPPQPRRMPGTVGPGSTPDAAPPPPRRVPGGSGSGSTPDDAAPGRARVVSTGLSDLRDPSQPLPPDLTIRVDESYLVWTEIGAPQPGALDDVLAELPDVVPAHADLDVELFPRDGGIEIESAATAVISLRGDDDPVVSRWAARPSNGRAGRVYFRIRAVEAGTHSLRCNLYHQQVLLQSRVITLTATSAPERQRGALGVTLDFALQTSFDQTWFDDREPHRLSLLVNENPDGSHLFVFHGSEEDERHQSSAVIGEGEIGTLVREVRGALQLASYGAEAAYDNAFRDQFRHRAPDRAALTVDLVRMAVRGHRMYLRIARHLAPPTAGLDQRKARQQLERLTRRPGYLQIATTISPTLLLPAGLVYDHPTSVERTGHRLCQAFVDAMDAERAQADPTPSASAAELAVGADDRAAWLIDEPCFQGDCPERDDELVVCPSGFWGYRHRIGTPASCVPQVDVFTGEPTEIDSDAASHVPFTGRPRVVVARATTLTQFDTHRTKLQDLAGLELASIVSDRESLFETLADIHPQVVYLYCHGGVRNTMPFLEVGDEGSTPITPETVQTKCYWPDDRPLVFLNGCRTAALSPHDAHEFVTAFTGEPMACGVIGTEVTIVEDLARPFAEAFLDELQPGTTGRSETVGEAIRRARLRLLQRENPLGLVYTPFVLPDIRLVRTA